MAIHVEVQGADQIEITLTKMIVELAHFQDEKAAPMLIAWQQEDMRRKFPNISRDSETTVSTKVWPRSRLSQKQKPKTFTKPVTKIYAKPIMRTGLGLFHSQRAILRPELFTKLCERMSKLMSETLQWTK